MSFGMDNAVVESHHGVTLVGGGPVSRAALALALAHAPRLVAADGGADRALRLGHVPEAVIGDMDSLSDVAKIQLSERLHYVAEQETTDFDKALRLIRAPFVLGLGFAGARMDHGLAVLNSLVAMPTAAA
jgi:thiamine pyrophosphokinase